MTRAVRIHETGNADVLKIEDVTVREPGEGEVRIRVEAIGLNRAEVMFRNGAYLESPNLPAGMGYEGAGIVEAVGPGVRDFAEGDAVAVAPAFSMNAYSMYAESTIVPAHALTVRPAGLDAVQSAAIWMAYLTAYGALIEFGQLQAGEAVLIPAASSSVGLAAIQIANHVGATPIAMSRTNAKVEQLKKAGAAHVIVSESQDIAGETMRLTNNAGARIVFDPVAGSTVNDLANAMSPGGTMFLYGALAPDETPFPLFTALAKALTLRGYTVLEIFADEQAFARGKQFVFDGIASGDLVPTVDRVFDFDDIVEAHRYMESNQQFGKIVVRIP
ncbi:zinc-dependent alcohol dehydrogenase family protein [Salinisphaera hydrothermalis]|uniref:Quinone oxidoreductase n=1 Tax=Salinisphaera hydrothermalis (strain C41B8) TaxID=1304275 RepID=A0A084IN07_SALHC|nr:zinc-dependent alcohol dehydrogenase family protein [Salinisphaera hydrothermalis]KEZ78091.1 quinone oxidoreductase [Salinisphaera hydrothermalis C41B8]